MTIPLRDPSTAQAALRAIVGIALLSMALLGLLVPSSAVASPPDPTGPYERAVVTRDAEGGVAVDVAEGSGGAWFRMSLDPTRTYRVAVAGRPRSGSFTLRTRTDDRVPTWRQAPSGTEVHRISGTAELELLIYTDTGGSYTLTALDVEACDGPCLKDSGLRSRILAESPSLATALDRGDRWAATQAILAWVAPKITFAAGGVQAMPTVDMSAAEILDGNLIPGRQGVYCLGAADLLRKLLGLFGIPSSILEFGDVTDGLTHATVAVAIDGTDGIEYRLIDPTFAMDLQVADTEHPVTIAEALELWRAGLVPSRLVPATSPLEDRRVLVRDGDTARPVRCGDMVPRSSACGLADYAAIWDPVLARNGYDPGLGGLLELLGTRPLFSPDYHGVPDDLQDLHHIFMDAVASGDNEVHIASLPLPPTRRRSPTLHGEPVTGATLAVDVGEWISAAPMSYDVSWLRCDAGTRACAAIAGVSGPRYDVEPTDDGARLRAVVVARNRYGDSPPAAVDSSQVSAMTGAAAALEDGAANPAVPPRVREALVGGGQMARELLTLLVERLSRCGPRALTTFRARIAGKGSLPVRLTVRDGRGRLVATWLPSSRRPAHLTRVRLHLTPLGRRLSRKRSVRLRLALRYRGARGELRSIKRPVRLRSR